MDDNLLASNDSDDFARLQRCSNCGQDEEYFEKLEEKLLEDDDPDRKFAPDSGRSVFEIECLKRKRAEEKQEE